MARVPLTKEEVVPFKLVLNVGKVALTEDQFFQLCSDNSDLFMELTAQKELIIISPNGLKSGWRDTTLATDLTIWARKDGTGIASGPSAGYTLPNGAIRGPDACWIRRDRLNVLTDYIYRPGKTVEVLDNPTTISGDPVLPGFAFNVFEIW